MTEPKKHARAGSRWNSSNRHPQKRIEQPKGFARGCRVSPKRDIVPKQEK